VTRYAPCSKRVTRMQRIPSTYSRRAVLRAAGGLAVTGAFAAACGGNSGRPDGGGSGATLSQWYHEYGEEGVQQAVTRYAAAYKDATVKVQWTPGDYDSKLASALLTSGGPDVYESQVTIDRVRANQVVDLSDLLGSARDDFSAAMLAASTVDGKLYGIPSAEDMQLLYYRKSLLAAAGVQPPTTVDELIDAAKATTKGKVKGFFAGNDGGASVLGGPALWSAGLDWVTPDHKVAFDDPRAATALGKLRELYTSKALLLGAPADWSDPSAFTQGLCAMQWTGLWTMPAIQQAFGDDFGVLPWPALSAGGKGAVPIGAFAQSVNGKSSQIDAAKAYVKWLWVDQTDYQSEFQLNFGFHIPPRKSIAAAGDKLKSGPPQQAVDYATNLGYAANRPDWTAKSQSAFGDAVTNIVSKGADPAAEVRTAVGKVNAELDRLFK
jgi:multiple sugar transport system substrate-binding protein